jgi:hypothetical protein
MMGFIISALLGSIVIFFIIRFFTGCDRPKKEDISIKLGIDGQHSEKHIPDRVYNSLDDWKKDTTVAWKKDDVPLETEFIYEKWDRLNENYVKEHRSVNVEEIIKDSRNDFYLCGYCLDRADLRTFHLDRISSKVTYKGRQYDPYAFIEKFDVF